MVHFAVFLVKKGIYNPTPKRLNKVFKRSIIIELSLYLTIGICGYYSTGEKTPYVFILRPALPDTDDTAITIARIAFTFNLQVAIATVGNPLRKQIWSAFKV